MKEVADGRKFEKECYKTLAKILHVYNTITHLQLRREDLPPRDQRYVFTSNNASQAELGDRAYYVIPFWRVGHRYYWLAASVDLAFQEKCYLMSVSLVVFEGEATDNIKTPILRAEWDAIQESPQRAKQRSTPVVHAQPHWHVYPTAAGTAEYAERAEPKFEADIQVFSFPQRHRAKQFHFAMASQWHTNGMDSHALDLEVDSLLRWLEGCLTYIRSQLTYVYS